jgi:hypothetical protein
MSAQGADATHAAVKAARRPRDIASSFIVVELPKLSLLVVSAKQFFGGRHVDLATEAGASASLRSSVIASKAKQRCNHVSKIARLHAVMIAVPSNFALAVLIGVRDCLKSL